MRRIRYQVACSLDGYIAAPNGEYDWIPMDPDIDFASMFAQYDTLLMGRATYEVIKQSGEQYPGMKVIVFSRTLRPEDHPGVTIVNGNIEEYIEDLRALPGKDIWLFGGGRLFQTFFDFGLVDTVEPAILPVILGDGIPMFPSPSVRGSLRLTGHRIFEKTGTIFVEYEVVK